MAEVPFPTHTLPPPPNFADAYARIHAASAAKKDAESCGTDDQSCASESTYNSDDTLPSHKDLETAMNLTVQDADGKKHTFRSLVEDQSKRTLVVFVRHFYCGLCQNYLRALSSSLPPSTLESHNPSTSLIIIGCGSPSVIPTYISKTTSSYPIYADPSRKLYDALRMTTTLTMGPKPRYQAESTAGSVFKSFVEVAKSGRDIWKSGNYMQIGGEFLFEGGECTWCHRMKSTRDHTEVEALRRVLGLEG